MWLLCILALAMLAMPIALVAKRANSRFHSITRAIVFACTALLFTLLIPRPLFGRYVPLALWVLLVPAIVANLLRARGAPTIDRKTYVGSLVVTAVALFAVVLVTTKAVAARHFTGESVSLQFPLRSGTYVVAHGGSEAIFNRHVGVHAQTYALDISKVNAFGFRARGLYPSDVHRYEIFGDAVYAPCSGTILVAVDGFEDLSPPKREPRDPGGNHVVVFCQGVSVILAHLMRGSVRVAVGESVTPQTIVGAVGNTGNTSEPHLHMHAVRGEVRDEMEIGRMGEPVAMVFEGRFLVRNDVVELRW